MEKTAWIFAGECISVVYLEPAWMQCLAGITGPNGAGKSTLLNAILFGLGENSAQLGARQVICWRNHNLCISSPSKR